MARTAASKKGRGKPPAKPETPPVWNLADLYSGRDSAALRADLARAAGEAKAFRLAYAGKLAGLSGDALGEAVARFEAIGELLGRIGSYAQLEYAAKVSDPEIGKFFQSIQEQSNAIEAELLFFTLEINRIDDAALAARRAESSKLARYAPWLDKVRLMRPHELPEEMERLLHEKDPSGRSAWVRLFDETIAALRFRVGAKEYTEAEALHFLSNPDRRKREAAGHAVAELFGRNIRLFAHITNTLAKEKETDDKWRRFQRPVSARNLSNQIEDAVVDALIGAVKSSFPRLSHRYYAMKARWLKLKKLKYWDRNAPLPFAADRQISWSDARETVLAAYRRFSPELAEIGQRFFTERWIDAEARPGKASGAFSHPTVPSAHPYILMNYLGRTRDVMTLAHELGHGVHQMLAREQGQLLSQTPLTLAETASVFGEMMTFRAMLDAETDAKTRKAMLAGKVEDMLNTVVRQIAFFEFERRVHDERRQGELLPDRLGEIFLDVQRESLGPAFDFDAEYRHFWAYIPHFVHSPFYVYAYAFGDCLVNSLYAQYARAHQGFAAKYLAMLKAGGSKGHKELLAPFGLDAGDPKFWAQGLGVIEGFIDELERMK